MFSRRRNRRTTSLLIALCIVHYTQGTSLNDSNNDPNNASPTTQPNTTNQTISSILSTSSTTPTQTTPSSQENTKNSTMTTPVSTIKISDSTNKTTTAVTQTPPTTTISTSSLNKTSAPERTTPSRSLETTPKTSAVSTKRTNQSTPTGTTKAPTGTTLTSTQPSSTLNGSITKKPTVTGPSTTVSPSTTSTAKNNGSKPATELPVHGSSTVSTTLQSTSTTVLVTTKNKTTVPSTVSATNQTSKQTTTPLVTTTITPTVTTTNQTTTVTTSTSTTNKPSTSTPGTSGAQFVYINEIIVDKQGIFQKIEIQTSNQLDLTHYAIVMVDGSTNKSLSVFYLGNGNESKPGLLMVQFNSSSTLSNKGIGIAIYDTRNLTSGNSFTGDWNVNEAGLIDALVIGKTYEDISVSLVNILTPGVDPFILDPSKYGQDRSISRCSNGKLRSTEMYAFINPSMGNDNHIKCTEREHFQNTLSIKMKMDCGQLQYPNNTVNEHLMRQIIKQVVKDVNRNCQCGITRMHVEDPTVQCCTDTVLDMKFVAPNKLQDKEFLQSFKAFIETTDNIEVNDQSYILDQKCLNDCCNQVIQPRSKKDNSKDIRVTVAVIVTLLVLFLIIVLVVYMYMRKKKMAVQQFRMSRLEEDYEDFDDMTVGIANDDHDEFVGGQEATFDLKP